MFGPDWPAGTPQFKLLGWGWPVVRCPKVKPSPVTTQWRGALSYCSLKAGDSRKHGTLGESYLQIYDCYPESWEILPEMQDRTPPLCLRALPGTARPLEWVSSNDQGGEMVCKVACTRGGQEEGNPHRYTAAVCKSPEGCHTGKTCPSGAPQGRDAGSGVGFISSSIHLPMQPTLSESWSVLGIEDQQGLISQGMGFYEVIMK